jgi:hypothetical protein
VTLAFVSAFVSVAVGADLRVGAAAAELQADDSMAIGGGIGPGKVQGQEGKLRAVAVVLDKPGSGKLAIVACDVLMMARDQLDPVVAEIGATVKIPASNVLINATHTHHAPTTATVHDYERDEVFCKRVQRGIVKAVKDAHANLGSENVRFSFWLGEESSVGQNSRLLLEDGAISWGGPCEDAVRPTGPFDPELPVLAFHDPSNRLKALIFNHSTHTIGARTPRRSPGFYGLAAQELEEQLGGIVCFLEGASGSTHNLTLGADEMIIRIKSAVLEALSKVQPRPVKMLKAIKRSFSYKVRTFDEAKEDAAVSSYCKKRMGQHADYVIKVFRKQRKVLSPQQGQRRSTWLQVMLIGDVAIVGVPGEMFTSLGQEIKRRSPFRYTYVAELANDWIGYVADLRAFELGGYQTWAGLHCFADPSTGQVIVDEAVTMLQELTE